MVDNNTFSGGWNRRPAWMRWLDILLRTAHVLVISVLFGGAVFRVPLASLASWQHLVLLSGAALIVSEVLHELRWPVQGRGLVAYIHIGLFILVWLKPGLAIPGLLAALVTGMVGSHMPKRLRYGSFIHGWGNLNRP